MEFVDALSLGFSVSLSWQNLYFCLIGVTLGTAVGVLPGLGPTATISLLLPLTFRMQPVSALIMLSGIFYGAMYGGSITSILMRVPGEAASIITCIDGYEMARRGRAGTALGMSAFASFIAGILSTIGIAVLGPAAAQLAFQFGPVERASLVVLGLIMVTMISTGSRLNGLAMVAAGLLLSTVGADFVTGMDRFTFGKGELSDGINIALLAMGMFGLSELLIMAEKAADASGLLPQPRRLVEMLPNSEDWRRSAAPIGRGSLVGFVLGILPGGGALLASFASYVIEKRVSSRPEEFGKGAIEGVAGPEAANNAAAQGAFIPMLSLGIPSNAITAMMLGALMIQGITPGPNLVRENPGLFWGTITSLLIGNGMLLVLNIPLLWLFVMLLRIPQYILSPLIMLFCFVGAYSLSNSSFDVTLVAAFGIAGYVLRKADYDPAPFVIAFVLGSIFEKALRQALLLGFGSPKIFLERPISATLLGVAALVLLIPLGRRWYGGKRGRTTSLS